MVTSKDYLKFILDQLSSLDKITYRSMMGECIIYYNGKIAAYLCDDRLLVKPVPSVVRIMPDAKYEPPYDGAKDMLLERMWMSGVFFKCCFARCIQSCRHRK